MGHARHVRRVEAGADNGQRTAFLGDGQPRQHLRAATEQEQVLEATRGRGAALALHL